MTLRRVLAVGPDAWRSTCCAAALPARLLRPPSAAGLDDELEVFEFEALRDVVRLLLDERLEELCNRLVGAGLLASATTFVSICAAAASCRA